MTDYTRSGIPARLGHGTDPRITVLTYVILTFAFSSVFWYLISVTPLVAANAAVLLTYTVAAMWCPATAAIIARLVFQRNLKGFGFGWGKTRLQLVGMLVPIGAGFFMFGSAWLSGVAPFNAERAATVFSPSFIPVFLYGIVFNLFAASGEELGWRGFLVPELSRWMGFTALALVSGAIWTVWHFPLMFLGTYQGTGPLWYSLLVFVPSVMGAGLVLAWLRLASGSIWVAVFFHGFWNYFIQQFYPALTVTTQAGNMMLGEFGWFGALANAVLAAVFWHYRYRLPGVVQGSR